MSNILYTQYANITSTVEALGAYDAIRATTGTSGYQQSVTLTLSNGGALDLTDELEGVRSVTVYASNDGNDVTGGAQGDYLNGGKGNDTLNGGAGDDYLYDNQQNGATDNDVLNGGANDDRLFSFAGSDTLNGGTGNDTIQALRGDTDTSRIVIDAGEGDDRIVSSGLASQATIEGGAGRDVLSAGNDLTRLSISNVEVLETAYGSITGRVAQFEGFDRIVAYDSNETASVTLRLSDGGALDLVDELGGKRAATVYASDAGNTITLDQGSDYLHGGKGNDTLNGGAGDDYLYDNQQNGATDNDVLNGGANDDRLFSFAGNDTLNGGTGNDTIQALRGDTDTSRIVIDAGEGDDRIVSSGLASQATIEGGAGRDVLSAGNDLTRLSISNVEVLETAYGTITGRVAQFEGFDRIVAYDSNETASVTLRLADGGALDLVDELGGKRAATVTMSDTATSLVTGDGSDMVTGGKGDDTFQGGAGSDVFDGGAGSDTAVFSKSFSSYAVDRSQAASARFVVKGEGDDVVTNVETGRFADGTYDFKTGTFTSSVPADKILTTDGKTVSGTVSQFEGYDVIQGSTTNPKAPIGLKVTDGGTLDLADELAGRAVTLEGSAAGNTITTGGGDDRLVQTIDKLDAGATTTFRGGAGIDTLELSAGAGPITAVALSDGSISFSVGGRTVVAGADVERFVINGSGGGDSLMGSAGNDWLDGRAGADTYKGSAGDDAYVFDNAGDKVIGEGSGGGTDTIWTSVTVNLADHGQVENLRLGSTGSIDGFGNALSNTIAGNASSNVIAGGLGNDSLYGKGGADIFHFGEKGGANKDTIWDFGDDDKIRLAKDVFTGLDADKDGKLDIGALTFGTKPSGTQAQVVYDAKSGNLFYDADGAGSAPTEAIAMIGKNLGFLDHTDFLIV